jgi:hypothetical protein
MTLFCVMQNRAEKDRCEEFITSPKPCGSDKRNGNHYSNHLASNDAHLEIHAESLMGKIPTKESILKSEMLDKLSSQREWKSVRSVLSASGLFFTKPEDDTIRDLVPLSEIESVSHTVEAKTHADVNIGSVANLLSSTGRTSHMIQLQTSEKGINCGKTYCLRMPSEESCRDWETALRSAIDGAAQRARAGVSIGRRAQNALRRYACKRVASLHHPTENHPPSCAHASIPLRLQTDSLSRHSDAATT